MTDPLNQFIDRMLDANARLRAENHGFRVMLQSLIDPEMYGHAVSAEVRQQLSALLGEGGG